MIGKKIINLIQTLQLIVVAVLLVLCLGGMPFGYKTFSILSGSMEPALHVGALAYVNTGVECDEIEEGDVIAFSIGDEKVVTHRVVEHDAQAQHFITKGDANDAVDLAPVPYGAVVGETVFSIPELGFLLMMFNDNKIVWMVGIVVVNILLCVISGLLPSGNGSAQSERK